MESKTDTEKLITENLNLVWYVIRRHFKKHWEAASEQEKEDVYQEGCLGLTKAAQMYKEEKGKFSTLACCWIKFAIVHYVGHKYRKTKGYITKSLDEISQNSLGNDYSLYCLLNADEGFEDNLVNIMVLRENLKRLTPKQKRAIYLYYYKHRNQKEMSKYLGVSQSQVSRLLLSAQRRLRNRMKLAM